MRIAVLFGSFNPMTNAHVGAMKTAVKAISADKGLFVATNGKYLKRKTVKISDPFYLSEDGEEEARLEALSKRENLANMASSKISYSEDEKERYHQFWWYIFF